MVNNTSFIDFYTLFELDRSMTEKELKKALSQRQAQVIKWKGSTDPNDTETLKGLQKMIENLRLAISTLSRPDSRREYDIQLDAAIKAGKVDKQIEKETRDIIERARAFFEQGKYELALKSAEEALENHINSEEPYEIISRSYFMMGDYDEAIESISNAVNIYSSSLYLRWLNIRFLIMTENMDEAQALLNASLKDFKNHAQLVAEQIYLYGYAERDDLIESTINKYMNSNPNDMDYRRYVAYNLVEIAQQCFVYDSASDMLLITEESTYNRCVRLLTIANSIYQDEYVQNELEYVLQFGEPVYDTDHNGLKLFYRIVGFILLAVAAFNVPSALDGENVLLTVILAGIGILLQGIASLVKKISYRPYWKVYRDTYRGFKESDDGALYNILMLPWDMVKQIFGAFFS